MRILFIDPNIPQNPGTGAQLRSYHLLKDLSRKHDFTVVCPYRRSAQSQIQSLGEFCRVEAVPMTPESNYLLLHRLLNRVRGQGRKYWLELQNFLKPGDLNRSLLFRKACARLVAGEINGGGYDLVDVQHSGTFPVVASHSRSTPVIASLHNVCWAMASRRAAVCGSVAGRFESHLWRKIERDCLRSAAVAVTVSSVESQRLRELSPLGEIACVPNGTDNTYFTPSEADRPPSREILFCGPMNYHPNVDAVEQFLKEIWPRIGTLEPACTFSVVGKEPPPRLRALDGDRVRCSGWIKDVREFYRRCAVFVVPLRLGGGTRLKILDALACECPVVCTPMACEGLKVRDGVHALIREIGPEFADAVLELLRNREKASQLGRNGRSLVVSRYNWSYISLLMDNVYTAGLENFQSRLKQRRLCSSSTVAAN